VSDLTLQAKTVKTRTPHRCIFCWAAIPVGELAHYWSGLYDGEFQSSYGHSECQARWEEDCEFNDYDIEFMPGDYPVPQRIREYYASARLED
jgi:hypothetical protein